MAAGHRSKTGWRRWHAGDSFVQVHRGCEDVVDRDIVVVRLSSVSSDGLGSTLIPKWLCDGAKDD
ncbi:hypothetical protein SESBI_42269 [Sesbania bispinosa]|nr:hypothetical protein SESBI_42269 [Sesbania bispinosa]